MKHATITVLETRRSIWGEGPVYWRDHLLHVDIEGHSIVRFCPESQQETVWDVGERVGMVAPRAAGGFVYAGDTGIRTFNPETGQHDTLSDPESDKRPDNRFNDGKCDTAGRLWAGTISTVKKKGDAALYRMDVDHKIHLILAGVTNSNGLCWTEDNQTMYYIDTPTKQIKAYDFHEDLGQIARPRVVVDTAALGLDGSPDGMTIDTKGRLWVAMVHAGAVMCFDPRSHGIVHRLDFPCCEVTACTFGGAFLNRLFVTTGQHENEPESGKVFVVDGLDAQGLPANVFNG